MTDNLESCPFPQHSGQGLTEEASSQCVRERDKWQGVLALGEPDVAAAEVWAFLKKDMKRKVG